MCYTDFPSPQNLCCSAYRKGFYEDLHRTVASLAVSLPNQRDTGQVRAADTRKLAQRAHQQLFVIGNADAEKLRQVAARLEFFHSSFARLVSRNVLNSSVPTTVVIFRDDASFVPFKPLYQGRPANLSGIFHPGAAVNNIA